MKKLLKSLRKVFGNFWFRLLLFLAVIAGIFALSGAFNSAEDMGKHILEIITSGDVLSIFLAAAVSLVVADIAIKVGRRLEETLKIEDDHHKIVCKYHAHEHLETTDGVPQKITENLYKPNGNFMYLTQVPVKRKKKPRNPEKEHTAEYRLRNQDIKAYQSGVLYLPSVNVFANVCGTALKFDDVNVRSEPPRFVRENSLALMEAHKGSSYKNSVTIRLNDVDYQDGVLTLKTGRSQYFDMLITNRCMDYELHGLTTVRQVYESGDRVLPLSKTKMGNQIGINGLVFTRDGYLLVEKRGYGKTTWKNKFAQPISLAMKRDSVPLRDDGTIDPDGAQKVFEKIVMGTLRTNFGFTESEVEPFDVTKNFFGLARDLLEGGKPNLYFYVTVKMTAAQLDEFLRRKFFDASVRAHKLDDMDYEQEKQTTAEEKRDGTFYPDVLGQKLDSDYYLIKYDDIRINYNYELNVKARKILRIKRKYYPRVRRAAQRLEGFSYKLRKAFNVGLKRECGEALLACLYYAELCMDRLKREQEQTVEKL